MILDIECPFCHAEPGEVCTVRATTWQIPMGHAARRKADVAQVVRVTDAP
jgi:hypothetical protein